MYSHKVISGTSLGSRAEVTGGSASRTAVLASRAAVLASRAAAGGVLTGS